MERVTVALSVLTMTSSLITVSSLRDSYRKDRNPAHNSGGLRSEEHWLPCGGLVGMTTNVGYQEKL